MMTKERYEEAKRAYAALMKCYPLTLEDLPDEEWLPINDSYFVSNFGRVKSFWHDKQKIMKPLFGSGYLRVNLRKNGKYKTCLIHRLVALCFIPNPEGKPQVNHRDGHKFNNHVSNLEWCTHAENVQHAFTIGLQVAPQGEQSTLAKLTNEQARYIRTNPDGLNQYELAEMFSVCQMTINHIQLGKKYKTAGGSVRKAKPKKPRISDDLRQQIRAEYQKGVRGHGSIALAKKFGVSDTTILCIVHEV